MLSAGLGAAPTFGGAGANKVALHVRQAAENSNHQPPGAGVGPQFRQGSELRLGVDDMFDNAEQIKGAAGEAVDPRHPHYVAGGEGLKHPEKLAAVGPRARDLLAVDVAAASGGAKLLKLAVEGLAYGADAGIADEPFFGMSFGHILRKL
jgi:hypothetical protein